jgi:hypothetical protein
MCREEGMTEGKRVKLLRDRRGIYIGVRTRCAMTSNTEHKFADTNRHPVEVPDTFAVARWPRDADVATIARCILGTLKYEPHGADTTPLRRALESVIDHEQRAPSTERAR